MSESRHGRVVQEGQPARRWIAVIGIDEYRHERKLTNAVSDATGAQREFEKLGYALAVPPLLDAAATRHAIEHLVRRDLAQLSSLDSLIVFFAGHGCTRRHRVGARELTTGYLLPVDADDEPSSWIDVDTWLRGIARLPPRHILVVLDACYSGIALSSSVRWGRDNGQLPSLPFPELDARPSRLVITSAQDDQIAADNGPKFGHSLFTGCLIDAVTGGVASRMEYGAQFITGTQLAVWVQRRVRSYPGVQGGQTPGFGVFDLDERGEMLIPVRAMDDAVTSTAIPISESAERPSQGDIHGQVIQREGAASGGIPQPAILEMQVRPVSPARPRRRAPLALAGLASVVLGVGVGVYVAGREPKSLPPRIDQGGAMASVIDAGVDAVSPSDAAIASRVPTSGRLDGTARKPSPPMPAARLKTTSADTPITAPLPAKTQHEEISHPSASHPSPGIADSPSKSSAPDAASAASRRKASTTSSSPNTSTLAPGSCLVPFKTTPKDAEILVNDDVRGTTPVSLALPCGEPVTVVLKKALYAPVTKTLTPAPNTSVFYILRHQTVLMRVSSTPSRVQVTYKDFPGAAPGTTPSAMKIYAGDKITLRFVLAGYETLERDIVPVEGGSVDVTLKKLFLGSP